MAQKPKAQIQSKQPPKIIFSAIIPASAKDAESQNLKDLIASIKAQDFPQDQIEILVITEGDSEQAKAIGIKKAQGDILCMLCADNMIREVSAFKEIYYLFKNNLDCVGIYSKNYRLIRDDNSLNRYFSLIGGNDVICFYLGKNDRKPFYEDNEDECWTALRFDKKTPSLGCNGTFIRKDAYIQTDLDNYYPMDNCKDLQRLGYKSWIRTNGSYIWHRTSDNLISFLTKRYKYAKDLYCDRSNRRWKMLDTKEDYLKLLGFVISTLTVIPCLIISTRGFLRARDFAWYLHWPVCVGFLITYGILAVRNLIKYGRLFQCRK